MQMTVDAEAIAETILSLERGALDRWGRGDIEGPLDLCADDVTYFDPVTAVRIDGLAAMQDYLGPWAGRIRVPRYEMLNPQVVTDGSMAVLSYNLVNYIQGAGGAETVGSRWNSTQVYRRSGDRWMIVHSHWSFTRHPAFENMSPEATEGLQA